MNLGRVFNFVIGARGTGKTYGALKYLLEKRIYFMYLRRTLTQVQIITTPEMSPFKDINSDLEMNVGFSPIAKNTYGIYEMEGDEKGGQHPSGAPVGVCTALSTFSNLRGFSGRDIEVIVFDEFIPERSERPIKDEAGAFLNMYETINRNRELQGKAPVQVLCLANSNQIAASIMVDLELIRPVEKMIKRRTSEVFIDERNTAIFLPSDSPISRQKRETALYKFSSGTRYYDMAIENQFLDYDDMDVVSRSLKDYYLIVEWGELCVYIHRSELRYYCTLHRQGGAPHYNTNSIDSKRFRRDYVFLWHDYLNKAVEFESFLCKTLLTRAFTQSII